MRYRSDQSTSRCGQRLEIEASGHGPQAVTKGSDLSRGHDPWVRSEPENLIFRLSSESVRGDDARRFGQRRRDPQTHVPICLFGFSPKPVDHAPTSRNASTHGPRSALTEPENCHEFCLRIGTRREAWMSSRTPADRREGHGRHAQSPTGSAAESSPSVGREAQRTWPFAACRPSSASSHRRQDASLRSAPAPRG